MTTPSAVPWIADREVYAGLPDSAVLTRRLVRWQKWARGRLTRATPCDAPVNRNESTAVTAPLSTASAAWRYCGGFYALPSPIPCHTIKLWLRRDGGGSAKFVSRRSGRELGAATWSGIGDTSLSLTGIEAPDVVDVYLSASASAAHLQSIGGYWDLRAEALEGVTLETAYSAALSLAGLPGSGQADSAYLLRWLARKANQMMADRPRQVVATGSSHGTGVYTNATGLRVSAKIPSVAVRASTESALGMRMTPLDPGGSEITASYIGVDASGFHVYRFATGFAVPTTVRIDFRHHYLQPTTTGGYLLVTEDDGTAASVGLGAESLPAAFEDIDERSILSRSPIRASTRAALVRNLYWLLAKKTRVLACLTPYRNFAHHTGASATYLVQAANDGWSKQLRCYAGKVRRFSSSSYAGVTPVEIGNQRFAWARWNGSAYQDLAGELPPEPHVYLWDGSYGWYAPHSWDTVEDHSLAPGAQGLFYRHWVNPDGAPTPAEIFHGAVFEELPDGTPLTTWP